mgnify:CR=1 FL=1
MLINVVLDFFKYCELTAKTILSKNNNEINVNVNPWQEGSGEPRPTELVAAM